MAVQSEPTTRHASQQRILDLLDAFRDAIDSLPPDARVIWLPSAYFVDRSTFVEMFRGQRVKLDGATGALSVEVDGVTFRATGERPQTATTELIL